MKVLIYGNKSLSSIFNLESNMKYLILIPMCITLLSGCTINSQTEGNLIKPGMIETNE